MNNVSVNAAGTRNATDDRKETIASANSPNCNRKRTIKPDKTDASVNTVSVSIGRKLVKANELYKLHFHGFLATISTKNHIGGDNTILCQSTTMRDATISPPR